MVMEELYVWKKILSVQLLKVVNKYPIKVCVINKNFLVNGIMELVYNNNVHNLQLLQTVHLFF